MKRITIEIPDYYDLEMITGRFTSYNNYVIKLLDLYSIDEKTGEIIYSCPIFNHFVDKEFDVQIPTVLFTTEGLVISNPLDIGKFKREVGHD